jgi:hypothetical protein
MSLLARLRVRAWRWAVDVAERRLRRAYDRLVDIESR